MRDQATRRLVARGPLQVLLLVGLLAVAVWVPFGLPSHRVFRFTLVLVDVVAVLGLSLATGFNGQISLGHGVFFAVGAYTSSALVVKAGWPYLTTVLPALAVAFVTGTAVGLLTRRIHGLYLAVVTLVLAVAAVPILKRSRSITGGAMGLSVGRPPAPSWSGLADDQWMYLLALVATVLAMVVARNLVCSRPGRAIIAIREDEIAAATMGIDVGRAKAVTFGWSAMLAGLGGVLFAWTFGYVAPESFGFRLSIDLIVMLVVGGLGSLWGPLLGVLALRVLAGAWVGLFGAAVGSVGADIGRAPGVGLGVLVVAIMMFAPRGLAGLGRRVRRSLAPH